MVETTNILSVLEYFIKGIKSRNSITISDIEYKENDLKNAVLLIFKNALEKYPTNKYQEELNWLILQAKYQQVLNSFDTKREERARETEDEYYSFVTQYPNSKHLAAAEKIGKDIKKILQKYNK